ncbi:hypothetical protein NDN08_007355 [Rhodosorus marinus]|uniref:Uncharacterized protein n=1 Tax=Rhodosorus marinus TaxID=101924 RepID=A0AAV8ULK3_9RHOD|nr:hypothetical protein NDN08_007355 [Rhodosorus marinus]
MLPSMVVSLRFILLMSLLCQTIVLPEGTAADTEEEGIRSEERALIDVHQAQIVSGSEKHKPWLETEAEKLKFGRMEATNMIQSLETVGRDEFVPMEHLVEKEMEAYVSSKYVRALSWTVSLLVVSMPLLIAIYGLRKMSERFSVRHFVLLGNFVNTCIGTLLCIIGLATGRNPLADLQEMGNANFIVLQLLVALGFVLFCALLVTAIRSADTVQEKDIFIAELVFYIIVAFVYKGLILHPAILGKPIKPSWIWYPIFSGVFMSMTFLSAVVGAINGQHKAIMKLDIENGNGKDA